MINGERLQILQERMRALDPNEHEIYTFLGCEQAERINMKKVMERFQTQREQGTRKLVAEGSYDKNLVKAINCRVIQAADYMVKVRNFTGKLLDQLHKRIKKILRENNMHGK